MTETRAIPMHPELPHLTHLSYFFIAGAQPMGRATRFMTPGKQYGQSAIDQITAAVMATVARLDATNRYGPEDAATV